MNKVTVITNIPAPYRVDFFNYLQQHYSDYEFSIIYTNKNEDNRSWEVSLENQENWTILKSKIFRIRTRLDVKYIHLPMGVFRELKRNDPDIIIGFEYNIAALLGLMWSRFKKRKFIHLTDGTLFSERDINFIQKLSRRITIRNADAYIASSTKAMEKLLFWGADKKKIFVSLLTINIDYYFKHVLKGRKADKEKPHLLFVGRIIECKGLDLLINALAKVNSNFVLHIVGDGDENCLNELKAQIEERQLDSSVELKGFMQQREIVDEYDWADIFVLPSRGDCYGLVMIEAMAAGNRIVASKYAEGAYDIVNKNVGCIIDPYDIKSFSETLRTEMMKVEERNHSIEDRVANCERFQFANTSQEFVKAIKYVMEK